MVSVIVQPVFDVLWRHCAVGGAVMVICLIADCFLKCTSGIVFIMRGKPENDVFFFSFYTIYIQHNTRRFHSVYAQPIFHDCFCTPTKRWERGGIQESIDTIG